MKGRGKKKVSRKVTTQKKQKREISPFPDVVWCLALLDLIGNL